MRGLWLLAAVVVLAGCGEDPRVAPLEARVRVLEGEKAALDGKLREYVTSDALLQEKLKKADASREYAESLRAQANEASAEQAALVRDLERRNAALSLDVERARRGQAAAEGRAKSAGFAADEARALAADEAERREAAEAEALAAEAERGGGRAASTPVDGRAAAACAAIAQALNYRKVSGDLTDPLKVDTAFLEWLTTDGGWSSRDVADLSAWTLEVWRAVDAAAAVPAKSNKPRDIEARDNGRKLNQALLDVREEFLDGDTAAALKGFRFWYPEK